ncbi:APH(3') family aminoglycoside O-phosphotransferase [Duganella sp. HH101]|uniref:APH(3') family aminoglycoside O-phosphotransferase n=1 Tax=Duganella sp. HH101 TaxID=1781066 RepID=UPI000874FB37|nr:APH(3') family aminoglycoside O-phosphotransferase [Duganella sp. HH101]OFA04193.1 aminoglycoside 3'-phosphotransferase [Duganella sp. HH101]
MPLKLPSAIAGFIGDAVLERDEIGESPCQVHRFRRGDEVFFLKTSPLVYASTTYSVMREAAVLQWLAGRVNVPEVVLAAPADDGECMITRAVPGVPLSSLIAEGRPVLELFREALRQLQSVSVADCPFDSGAAARLRELDYLVGKGLIDEDYDFEQWPGLATPADLLARLRATIPNEDLVFSHGDLCDNNVFVDQRGELHFIDAGRGGLADRWLDIAFIHRNLRDDVSEHSAAQFLDGLGVPDALAKREFFEQLDELF